MRLTPLSLVIWVPVLGGCGPEPGSSRAQVLPAAAPYREMRLAAESTDPLEPGALVELRPGVLLGAERNTAEVWRFDFGSHPPRPRLLRRVRPDLRGRTVAIAAWGDEVATLDRTGTLAVWDSSMTRERRSVPLGGVEGSRHLGIAAGGSGTWWVLSEEVRVDGAAAAPSARVLLRRVDGRTGRVDLARVFRKGPEGLTASWGITGSGDTLTLSASAPTRILRFSTRSSRVLTEVRPVRARERALDPAERRRIRTLVSQLPPRWRESVHVPRHRAPLTRAWAYGSGFLFRAEAGWNAYALDWYCRDGFRRTVVDGPDVTDVSVTGEFATVLRRGGSGDAVLSLYRLDGLSLSCTP